MDKKLLSLNGVFAVLKPAGETSAKTIDRVKTSLLRAALGPAANNNQVFKRLSRQVKVGHGGTLDPMATGVLVVGLNGGCRDLSKYLSGNKAYTATARFGEHFDTLDVTGKLLQKDEKWKAEEGVDFDGKVNGTLNKFVGEQVMQVPPAFSAIHVNGKRAYEIARKESNERDDTAETTPQADSEPCKEASFEIPARPVAIYSLVYKSLELPDFELQVSCGGGCYIRSLIRDIAAEVNTLAVMTGLKRTKQGLFTEEMCLKDSTEWGNIESVSEAIDRANATLV